MALDGTAPGPALLSALVAREEIRQLAARYAVAVDARDLETLVGLFVADVDAGELGKGRQALRRSFEQSLRQVGVTFLLVGTHLIDLVDGERARGTVYCKGEIEVDGRWVHQAIVYRDRYRREEGGWRFVGRRHELCYGVDAGYNPLDQPPADWPARHEGRGTVPQSWPTWDPFWLSEAGDG